MKVKKLDLLFIAAQNQECLEIRQLLKDLVDGYVPEVGVVDLVHEVNSND